MKILRFKLIFFKRGVPVIVSPQVDEAMSVIKKRSLEIGVCAA